MVYFTADLHLGHEAVIRMQQRPFANAQDMNAVLIGNINSVVGKNDKLYILGDISHHISAEESNELISRINGRKYLLLGNHDITGDPEVCQYDLSLFEWVGDYLKINIYGMKIVMMHYPMLSWPKMMAGSVMLHGHIHSDFSYNKANMEAGIRRFDVGVDANSYCPVSIYDIKRMSESTLPAITTRTNLYIPGLWSGERVTLERYASDHPDRILIVRIRGGSENLDDWENSEDLLHRKVFSAYSIGESKWLVEIEQEVPE